VTLVVIISLIISAFVGFISIATQRYVLNQLGNQDKKKVVFIYGFGTTLGVFLAFMVMLRLKLPVNSFFEFIIQILLVAVIAIVAGKIMYAVSPKAYKDIKARE